MGKRGQGTIDGGSVHFSPTAINACIGECFIAYHVEKQHKEESAQLLPYNVW